MIIEADKSSNHRGVPTGWGAREKLWFESKGALMAVFFLWEGQSFFF